MGIVARQSIKGSLANYLGVAIGFLTTFFVLTKCLTEEQIGLTRVLVDAATLFAAFAQMGTNSSIIKYFPYFRDSKRNRGIFGLSLLLSFVGFSILATGLLLFKGDIIATYSEQNSMISDYFYLLLPLTFFVLYLTIFETNANALMRITVPKIVREVVIRVLTLVCYLLYGYKIIDFSLFIVLFTASYGVAMLLNLFYLIKLGHISIKLDLKSIDKGVIKAMLRFSLFMTVIVLAGNSQFLGSLFIGAKKGLALTGIYTIAFFIANVVEVPYRSLGAISRPLVAEAAKNNDWTGMGVIARRVSLHQLLVSLLVLLLIWVNIDALFDIIPNGKVYEDGKWVVLILGMAKVMNSTLSISIDVLNYSKHYRLSLLFVLTLSIATILLNIYLIPLWSIKGAAFALLFAYSLYYLILLVYLWLTLHVSPFSLAQVKVVLIVALMVGANWLWELTVAKLLLANGSTFMLILNAAIKTTLLFGAGILLIYHSHISSYVNELIDKVIRQIKTVKQ